MLDNERTLTGDIEQVGDQYRIKRLVGETWVPVNKALRLCGSLEEAYGYLSSRANLRDPDERIRLAEWCRQHAMKDEALKEVEAAAEGSSPTTRASGGWLNHLREIARGELRPQARPASARSRSQLWRTWT